MTSHSKNHRPTGETDVYVRTEPVNESIDGLLVDPPRKFGIVEMYARAMGPREPIQIVKDEPDADARPRAPWGSLSRDHIIEAALEFIENGTYETMTIRSLAAHLGVAPMTLYRHIRDRDDLLDEVTDQLLAKCWEPTERREQRHAWMMDAAMRFRRLLVAQPAVLHVYLSHPVATPAALERMQSMLSVLREAGLDDQAAERLYATLHTYTIGFAALEASRSAWTSTNKTADATMTRLAAFTTTNQFLAGTDLLLHGVKDSR